MEKNKKKMARRRKTRRTRGGLPAPSPRRERMGFGLPRVHGGLDVLLHPRATDRPWRYLPLVLALAFAARAAVALSGDFVLHPDEIMQYLEPAHRLVFGSGVVYWEYFYGARSWLVPGMIAGVLKLFDALGLGQPFWYIGGVKLLFCAVSLAIPAGMYFFARCHFGEAAGRAALVAGAFWYELAGFAHKPMTEFVATAPLLGLLALCVRPTLNNPRQIWLAAFLAVLTAALRMQYAPLALVLLGVVFLRTPKKIQLTLAATGFAVAVGVFDAVTWDGGLFHSYLTNLRYNLARGPGRAGESPPYQFLSWLVLAGGGLSLVCIATSLRRLRRYGFLLALTALVLLAHSLQSHKEYRFVFAVIPLWLLIGAGLMARLAERRDGLRRLTRWATALFAAVSLAGILNTLPYQERVYEAWSRETGIVNFVRNQDPIFPAYRYLSRTPGVTAVGQVDRPYYNLPGYYYLHRMIPFYDVFTGRRIAENPEMISASVSHMISEDPKFSFPGYSVEREFGAVRILRRDENEPAVRPWLDYAPVMVFDRTKRIMRRIDPNAPSPPSYYGIRFADRERP